MAQINVTDLTFCYEGSFDNIFEKVSFSIDTNWKLGFIGRNGKGKTTFLNLLLGKYEYQGSISTSVVFDYFPYQLSEAQIGQLAVEFCEEIKTGCEPAFIPLRICVSVDKCILRCKRPKGKNIGH